ncbi:MAG: hypothetical protein JWQ48_3215 [Conexibacter sp.]|nr:hypothetical protein [Conexibacter sp.]
MAILGRSSRLRRHAVVVLLVSCTSALALARAADAAAWQQISPVAPRLGNDAGVIGDGARYVAFELRPGVVRVIDALYPNTPIETPVHLACTATSDPTVQLVAIGGGQLLVMCLGKADDGVTGWYPTVFTSRRGRGTMFPASRRGEEAASRTSPTRSAPAGSRD